MTNFNEIINGSKPSQRPKTLRDLDSTITTMKTKREESKQKNFVTKRTVDMHDDELDRTDPYHDQRVLDNVYNSQPRQGRIRRKDKDMILQKETDGVKNRQWMVFMLAIVGIFFLISLQYTVKDDWVLVIVILLGSMMFLPVGMIVGWAFLDPYVRCKILRKASKKNFGVINFVGKGQKIVSKIKNFDNALIWKKNETWVITKEHVYQLSKDGDTIVERAKIDPESIVTLIDTVPVLFVDLDSMQPLSLARDRREGINPLELGSTLKAWVDNQLAKAMFLKKTMDIYLLIILITSVVAVGLSYYNMNRISELTTELTTIKGKLSLILELLQSTA